MSNITKYDYIRLEPADNGFTLSYEEYSKPTTGKTFDSPDYHRRELVFTDEQADEAFAKFKELIMFNKGVRASSTPLHPTKATALSS